ncbi:MAG: hypothetical protein WC055_00720 [Melioribacteraceae bacterium]
MIDEFSENYLDVVLIPSKDHNTAMDGGMIRVAQNRNPEWYRNLCSNHPKKKQRTRKKPQTSIKKEDIISIIRNLIKTGDSKSKYVYFILDEINTRFELNTLNEFVEFKDQF